MSTSEGLRARQWVSLPGGSCNVRMGDGLLDEASAVFKGAVGKPRRAALVVETGVAETAETLLSRQLADAGFEAVRLEVPAGVAGRTLDAAQQLFVELAEAGITADDLVVAAGDVDALSLASFASTQWCGGVPLAMIPTSQTGLLEAPVTPRGLDVGEHECLLSARPSVKQVLFDLDVALKPELDEDALMARVIMVVTAMCDSEAAFSRLWDRTEQLCAGDVEVLCEQLKDTIKTRGKIMSSTALALRQSIAYGESFARALRRLVGECELAPSVARAEALRFLARLSCGEGHFAVDDVLAQDELLERLELPTITAAVDSAELVRAVREERFMRSNRFLLGLPRKLGRVRLAAVDDELIAEHVAAWCASRCA